MLKFNHLILAGLVLSVSCATEKSSTLRQLATPAKNDKKWFERTNLYYGRLINFLSKSSEKPIETFEELRSEKPILKLSQIPILFPGHDVGKTYFLSKREDVLDVLSHPKEFSVRFYSKKIAGPVGPHMLGTDNTEYNLKEKPWMRSLLPHQDFPKIKQLSFALATEAIKEVAESRPHSKRIQIEIVNSLARKVPVQLSGAYFGFPGPDLKTMYRWSYIGQQHFFHNIYNNPLVKKRANKMGREMISYTKKLIAQKKQEIAASKDPKQFDDILARMIKSGPPEALKDQVARIEYNVIGLVLASVETTQTAVVNALDEIMDRPDIFALAKKAALENNDKLLESIALEALRFNPQAPFIVRYAEEDYVVAAGTSRETKIPQGSVLLVGLQSAMFDEENIKDPEAFKLDRSEDTYFHFGYGHHRCLGDYLGRAMLTQILKSLLILPNLSRAAGKAGQVEAKNGPYPESFILEFDAFSQN